MERYNIKSVEKKWQNIWAKEKIHSSKINMVKNYDEGFCNIC